MIKFQMMPIHMMLEMYWLMRVLLWLSRSNWMRKMRKGVMKRVAMNEKVRAAILDGWLVMAVEKRIEELKMEPQVWQKYGLGSIPQTWYKLVFKSLQVFGCLQACGYTFLAGVTFS